MLDNYLTSDSVIILKSLQEKYGDGLDSLEFKSLLVDNLISTEDLYAITKWGYDAFRDPLVIPFARAEGGPDLYIQLCLFGHFALGLFHDPNFPSINQHHGVTEGGCEAFSNLGIRWFMTKKENRQYVPLVSQYSSVAMSALTSEWTEECIVNHLITFEELANVTNHVMRVLHDRDSKTYMTLEENLQYIPRLFKELGAMMQAQERNGRVHDTALEMVQDYMNNIR